MSFRIGSARSNLLVLATLLALVSACTPSAPGQNDQKPSGTPSDPVQKCTKEGESCVHSQGKLGVCTAKLSGCDAGICYACMSLH